MTSTISALTKTKKSEGITFRLSSDLAAKLRQDAEKKQISLNTLANQVLRDHIEWHNNAKLSDLTYLSKSLFSTVLKEISEERITNIAEEYVQNEYKDLVLLLKDKFNIETILEIKENWARISGFPYKYEKIDTNVDNTLVNNNQHETTKIVTAHHFTILHDMGPKYSLLLKQIDKFLFEYNLQVKIKSETTDNTYISTIEQP
ncbi:MAG: toxin-antitoxin system HicB family antitoxin [Thermoproteota archaeon]|nr:toxin-antitoxin system HicB family antitoxin [Thermoproteota archaeon]